MRRRTIVLFVAAVVVASCDESRRGGDRLASGRATEPASIVEVPHPDTSALSADLRAQIASLRELVESSSPRPAAGGDDAEKLGQAWGDLGRVYHAYGFLDAAAAAYANARAVHPTIALWPYLAGLIEVQRGRHDVAVERFESALEVAPELAVARLRLGQALIDLGRPEEAVPALEAAAKSPALAAAAFAALGRAVYDQGDAARARDYFERALEAQPGADLLHHSIGLAYRSLGDEARARDELARAGAKATTFPDAAAEGLDELRTTTGALLLRGSRALVSERPHEAVEQYRRAVAAAPQDAEARRSLALALRATGDLDGALAELQEAARLAPGDHVVRFDLGNIELARGAQQAAADAFAASLAIAPDFAPARFNLANAQLLLGQATDALANLERVIELDPGHRRARYQAAMAKAAAGRTEEGIHDLEALLEADPGFGPALIGIARLRHGAGDRAGARAAYDQVARGGGDVQFQVDAHVGLATMANEESRPEVEIEHLRAAVGLAPSRDDLRESLARTLESTRRFAEAAEERRALVELRPDVVMDRLLEATAWVQAGRSDTARERLEEGVERLPDDRVLSNSLARLLATAPDAGVRDGGRAVEIARRLYTAQPSPDVTETLAMALAEAGDYEQAMSVQRGLIAQVKNAGQTAHLPRLEANLRRFEGRQPVRM
jgi:tetratricopeptide (TPR) repeat protein